MSTHSKSPKTNLPEPKTPSTPLTLKTPKLLFPTLACLLATAAFYILTYQSRLVSFLPTQLEDMLHGLLLPIVPALGLFLLHRLLEVIITHRAFRPVHLLSLLAIILSVAVFVITGVIYLWIILYVLAAVIFGASLSFQKSHSLATDPANLRSSLLSTSVASFILGLINIVIIALAAFELIDQLLENILLSAVLVVTIPLQLALTFLCLTKLSPVKSIQPTSSSTPSANSAHPAGALSHFDRFLLGASFALTLISFTAYLAFIEQMFIEEYSHRQPCCSQPVYYDD